MSITINGSKTQLPDDSAREAVHSQHLEDVLNAFVLLRSFRVTEESYFDILLAGRNPVI